MQDLDFAEARVRELEGQNEELGSKYDALLAKQEASASLLPAIAPSAPAGVRAYSRGEQAVEVLQEVGGGAQPSGST